jgi:hypothetical protein
MLINNLFKVKDEIEQFLVRKVELRFWSISQMIYSVTRRGLDIDDRYAMVRDYFDVIKKNHISGIVFITIDSEMEEVCHLTGKDIIDCSDKQLELIGQMILTSMCVPAVKRNNIQLNSNYMHDKPLLKVVEESGNPTWFIQLFRKFSPIGPYEDNLQGFVRAQAFHYAICKYCRSCLVGTVRNNVLFRRKLKEILSFPLGK